MSAKHCGKRIVGIVLAAGKGSRFDSSGTHNKLLQLLPNGKSVAATTATTMRHSISRVIAVIPNGDDRLVAEFMQVQCAVTRLSGLAQHMSESIAHAIKLTNDVDGWIIALADMPFVRRETYKKLLDSLSSGAGIAVPVYDGTRGNPVAFAEEYGTKLSELSGDVGARSLLQTQAVVNVEVDDPGVCQDIDTTTDYVNLSRTMMSVQC